MLTETTVSKLREKRLSVMANALKERLADSQFQNMACGAVFPMVFYMALGAGVRRAGVVDEAFLNRLTAMVFKVFFPILMLKNIYWA